MKQAWWGWYCASAPAARPGLSMLPAFLGEAPEHGQAGGQAGGPDDLPPAGLIGIPED